MFVRRLITTALAAVLMFSLVASTGAYETRRVYQGKEAAAEKAKKPRSNSKLKPYAALVKDMVKVEGLFTFYHDTTDNSMLMEIKKDHFGPVYLCSEQRTAAEGAFFDAGSMGRSFPFYFKQVGETIMMMEKNLRVRADTSQAIVGAVNRGISDALFESTPIKSQPNKDGAVLIDPSDLFLRDAQNISYFLGQAARTGLRWDKKNSYFGTVKSFPQNSEIDVHLHYTTSKPLPGGTMQNPYSLYHVFHYSLSTLPETDYVPRVADDRVGYFLTLYQDYSTLDQADSYVRYINRWNLKKKNPDARVSEPVEPIVFWIENTVPEEYRDAFAEGVEFWNAAFEKIGFRNAIEAKQMPDTADWDPADVRYNTVRWFVMPGAGYAVGPSHANPFTGQIYSADIRVSADFIRYMFSNSDYFINPVSFDGTIQKDENVVPEEFYKHHEAHGMASCTYQRDAIEHATFGLVSALSSAGDFADKDSLTREYVHAYIVELVAHEIGHALGFRHNFKASTIYDLDQLMDREFTRENSTSGTVMDYCPPLIAGPNQEQGEFYASVPGPYDDWVIEYGYTDFGDKSLEEDAELVRAIAEKSTDPHLVYATDEDAFGSSPKSIDPLVNLFDHGSDPMKYAEHRIMLTNELWRNSISKVEKEGEPWVHVLRGFSSGWRSYFETASHVSKFVAGIYQRRDHIGQADGQLPFEPVSAERQRQAIQFLSDNVFASAAWNLPSDLHNKLQQTRHPDHNFSLYYVSQVDYPFHQMVLSTQNAVLSRLYSPFILGRLLNNLERVPDDADKYTMYEMFSNVRTSIWSELSGPRPVDNFRRQLQIRHLDYLIAIYLMKAVSYPSDARTLAANDLDIIKSQAQRALNASGLDGMTQAHLKEVIRQIDAAQGARKEYSDR